MISGRLVGPTAALAIVAAALGGAATMPPAAADSHPTTVVVGGRLGDTGLSREHVDCQTPERLLGDKPAPQTRLDPTGARGSHVATWPQTTSTEGLGVLAFADAPSQISDLSIDVRAVEGAITGAAVVRWQPEGLATSWIGLASLPADSDTAWHTVQAADLTYAWSEITADGRLVRSGSQQTISNFFVGRDDSAGARVGFVFGCNDAPFLVDGLSVTTPLTERTFDFEAAPSRISFRPSTKSLVFGRTIKGRTTVRTSARTDSVRAIVERRSSEGPKKVMSMRLDVGKDQWNWTPKQSGAHRVRILDQDEVAGSASGWVNVSVRQRVKASPSTRTVQRGRQFAVRGTVRPGEGTKILVQRLSGSGWKSVASKTIPGSRFDIKVRADVAGTVRYRVVATRTPQNDQGVSRAFSMTVTSPPPPSGGGSGDGGGSGGDDGSGGGTGGGGGGEEPPSGPQRPTT